MPDRAIQHVLRKGRFSANGLCYLITICTQDRAKLFDCQNKAQCVVTTLAAPETWPNAKLMCWVLMPDHWHGLVQLTGHESLSRCIQRFKSKVSMAIHQVTDYQQAVWQRSYHDHALRNDEIPERLANYILDNPVRANLCMTRADWPYKGSVWDI